MDYLDRLERNNEDFWEWFDLMWSRPEFPEDVDWDLYVQEPSPAEQAVMDANAELIRLEMES